jgi:hypothetical protein
MAVLKHSPVARIAIVLGSVAIVGCALVGLEGPLRPFGFDHRIHAAEGLDCSDCHIGAETADDPGMPTLGQCMLCHEALDAQKPPERHVAVLFVDGVYQAAHRSRLDPEVVFSHAKHVSRDDDCAACHVGIDANEHIDDLEPVSMDDCMACHTRQGAANDCATCHSQIDVGVRPRSHGSAWLELHGRVVRAHGEARVDQCTLCHSESSCAACHRDSPPRSHDHWFRRRTHGLYARTDRESCAACRRPDACDRCHREARPMSHRGSFGSPRNTHCLSCHFPLQSDECATCHRATPSHALGAPKPAWHSPGMNCVQCHGLTAPLPHVHKGDDCNACHR